MFFVNVFRVILNKDDVLTRDECVCCKSMGVPSQSAFLYVEMRILNSFTILLICVTTSAVI